MTVLNFNLNSDKNGGKITDFRYSKTLNELAGSWSAQAAGGTFTAGNSISFEGVMTNGIISKAQKDSSGLWHIEGYDAGIRLMRSTPDIEDLPTGDAKTVIQSLATFCGISLSMSGNGLSGFNVRTIVSGSTCAEAILELAMFSGYIAFINSSGVLVVQSPASTYTPPATNIIDDSGSDFDLDGYATQVTVILRKSSVEIDTETPTEPRKYYTGRTPSTSPNTQTYTGTFTGGSYSIRMLEPFNVAEYEQTSITKDGVTITTEQTHTYDYKHKTIWRGDQEYVLFAFIETGYTLVRTTTGTYPTSNGSVTFTETTTETMERSLSPYDAIGVPEDWKNQLDMVDTETITRSTVRTGGKAVTEDMPSYSPEFDTQITRRYSRELRGRGLLCTELERHYEARQVGAIAPVKVDDEYVPFYNRNLAIQTHTTPEWVEVDTYRTYYEQYDKEGACVLSTRSEYSDDGAKWLVAHALTDTGDEDLNEYQKSYAKFSKDSNGLEVSIGTSVMPSVWNFVELQGRMINYVGSDDEDAAFVNVDEWYENGGYRSLRVCPHFNETTGTCNAFALVDAEDGEECYHYNNNYLWKDCPRAKKALQHVKEQEKKQLDAPIIGTASRSGTSSRSPSIGYKREIYVDDNISDATAQTIANTIASNILTVKGVKGLRKTITIPYSPSLLPNGAIVEVSHDWENLQTSVTYRYEGTIPDFLVAQSVSGIASFVSAREASHLSVPKYGVVTAVNNNNISVTVDNSSVSCTTKLKNLGVGDNVLVSFPAGNKYRGQVISRL